MSKRKPVATVDEADERERFSPELEVVIRSDPTRGVVLMEMGMEVRLLGFTAAQAIHIGELLIQHGKRAQGH